MVRTYRDPRTNQVLYLRKYLDTNRYYLSLWKRADENEFDVTYDTHEAPTYDAHGNVAKWVKEK